MFHQTQLLLPDHADEPALLAEIARWVTPDAWLVTYNGRGFDWPLIEARYRLAGRAAPAHAGHLDLLPFVRRVFRHRMENARLRTVEEELLGVSRVGDVEGWEIPQIYLEVLRGGPIGPLAGVVIHNEKDVRSLGLLLAHVEHRYADRATRHEAPRGDLAGLARAYARDRRHDEALECLDDALAAAPPVRDPFGRTAVAPAVAPRGLARGAGRVVVAAGTAQLRRPCAGIRVARRAGERARRTARAVARRPRPGTRPRTAGRTSAWPPNGHGPCGASDAGRRRPRRGRRRRRPAEGSAPSPGSRSRSSASTVSTTRAAPSRRRARPGACSSGCAPRGGRTRAWRRTCSGAGQRLAARIRRPCRGRPAGRSRGPQSGLSPPCMRLTASARYGTPKTPGPSRISEPHGGPEAQVRVRAIPAAW